MLAEQALLVAEPLLQSHEVIMTGGAVLCCGRRVAWRDEEDDVKPSLIPLLGGSLLIPVAGYIFPQAIGGFLQKEVPGVYSSETLNIFFLFFL